MAQRFWRTLHGDVTVEEAQARLDKWCTTQGDIRLRATREAEPLAPMPYGTVLRLVTSSLTIEDRWLGQPPASNGHGMLLGQLWISRDEQQLLVAGPDQGARLASTPEPASHP